jgi:hypothetical protein
MLKKYVSIGLRGREELVKKSSRWVLKPKGSKARWPRHLRPSAVAHTEPVEREEKEAKTKDSMEYILESILKILLQDKHADVGDRLVRAPMVSPEEGVRLIRAFIRIKQPELRTAIIKLVTQIADEL